MRLVLAGLAGGLMAGAPGLLHGQGAVRDSVLVADDLLFQAVPTVTSASRYAQEVAEAPASISVITREEIRRMGYRSLTDILTSARGIYASNDRNYTYLGLRGFARTGNYNTRLLLLVDGHRINEPTSDYVGLALEMPVAVEDIERVEVVRGPGSSLYGTNAVLGVINVVTRRPTGAGAVAEGEAGSLGTWRGRLGWDGSIGAARLVVSTSYQASQGEDLRFPELGSAVPGDGVIRDLDREQSGTALVKAYLGPVEVMAGFGRRHKDIPTGSFETVLGARSFTSDRRIFSFIRYEHVYANLGRLALRTGFDSYRYEGTYAYEDGPHTDFQASAWWTLDAQYVRPAGRHRFVIGGELRLNTDLSQGGESGSEGAWEDSRSSQVGALFVQDEIRLGSALLTLGVRHDNYSDVGGTTNPRAALIVPVLRRTTLKLLAGRAFRSPNELEQFYYDGHSNKAAGPLDPERLTTYEIVVEQAVGASARITGSVYALSFRDVVTLETDPADGALVYTNRGASDGHGVELEIEGRVGPVDARASYAYQRVTERGWAGDPPNSPRHLGRLGGSLPLHRRATLGVEAHAVSRRLAHSGASVPGYLLTSARLIVSLLPDRAELILSGSNLLNSRVADPGGEEHRQVAISQPGRSLRVGLHTRF